MKLVMKLKFKFSYLLAISATAPFSLFAQDASYLSEEDFYEEELARPVVVSDPFESINRFTFQFNDFVYINVLTPVAKGYRAITPDPVERGALNFFDNLKYPVRLAGNLLQARWDSAWVETQRFAVNTTVGVAGVFRPADTMEGLAPIPREDIGQAFGAWGIDEGPFLILPLLGPSNLRDLGGYVADRAVNPLQEPFSLIDHWDWETRLGLAVTELVVTSPVMVSRYVEMKKGAIDPYSSLKNGYIQHRRAKIAE